MHLIESGTSNRESLKRLSDSRDVRGAQAALAASAQLVKLRLDDRQLRARDLLRAGVGPHRACIPWPTSDCARRRLVWRLAANHSTS